MAILNIRFLNGCYPVIIRIEWVDLKYLGAKMRPRPLLIPYGRDFLICRLAVNEHRFGGILGPHFVKLMVCYSFEHGQMVSHIT